MYKPGTRATGKRKAAKPRKPFTHIPVDAKLVRGYHGIPKGKGHDELIEKMEHPDILEKVYEEGIKPDVGRVIVYEPSFGSPQHRTNLLKIAGNLKKSAKKKDSPSPDFREISRTIKDSIDDIAPKKHSPKWKKEYDPRSLMALTDREPIRRTSQGRGQTGKYSKSTTLNGE